MLKKARAGHVTGGVVFGYDNVPQLGPDGKRSHTDRQVNAEEAAVVVRIFEMARDGRGLTRIAKALNREMAPAPKPRPKQRRAAWCPTSIREVLRRRLYVGEVLYDRRGAHPIRVAKPELRIIADALWAMVHARLAHTRAQYLKSTDGKLWGRPATGIAGQHLLSRLAACGKCGGPLYARSSTWGKGRKYFYACLAFHTRGVRGCSNGRPIPMTVADTAVVDAVEHDLLRMEVIGAELSRAIDAARQDDDHADTSRDALHARLATLDTELQHFTEAIAQGGAGLPTVIAAITQREAEKADLEAEVARREALRAAPALDDAAVRSAMASVLMDWQSALHENVAQSQQALRKLLIGRLVFTPDPDGGYTFTAEGRLDAVIAGRLPGLPTSVVSPRGTARS